MRRVLTLSFLVLASCASQDTTTTLPCRRLVYPNHARLVVIGDSQSAGTISTVANCPYSFADKISEIKQLNLDNRASPGTELSEKGLGTISQIAQVHSEPLNPTDTVLFVAGFNDVLRHGMDIVHLAKFTNDLYTLLDEVSDQVQLVIIASPPKLSDYSGYAGSTEASQIYTQIISAYPRRSNVIFVDLNSIFKPDPTKFYADHVHFTVQTQDELADYLTVN